MKPALLVIDAQQEYFAPHGKWALPDGERALERIHALIAAARAANIPVYFIRHQSQEADAGVFRPGSPGVALHPSLAPAPGEGSITKHFASAFAQTGLEEALRNAGVDTVIVSGYMTQLCCDTTTRAAEERGFSVLFAGDATAARDLRLNSEVFTHDRIHAATLAIMTEFAEVLTAEGVIARLRANGAA
jgi:nicotinamidase-related amidase